MGEKPPILITVWQSSAIKRQANQRQKFHTACCSAYGQTRFLHNTEASILGLYLYLISELLISSEEPGFISPWCTSQTPSDLVVGPSFFLVPTRITAFHLWSSLPYVIVFPVAALAEIHWPKAMIAAIATIPCSPLPPSPILMKYNHSNLQTANAWISQAKQLLSW